MTRPRFAFASRRLPAPPRQALILIAVVAAAAVVATQWARYGAAAPEQYGIFPRLFVFNDFVGALAMLVALALAAWCEPLQAATIAVARWIGRHPRATCALSFVALAAGALGVFMAHPLSMDEYAPLMQAHAFARGELTLHYPAPLLDRLVPRSFRGVFFILNSTTGTAVSAYWPGLALLLTPFVAMHAAWALNPALTALALALIGDLAARAGDAAGAADRRGWAMLAALASPVFVVDAMSFYAMSGLLTLNLLFVWLLLRPGHRHAFAAGVVGSLALVLHNPVPHGLLGATCIVWMALDRERRVRLPALLAGYLPLATLLGLGWPLVEYSLHPDGVVRVKAPESGVAHWLTLVSHTFHLPNKDLFEMRQMATWKIWIWACPGVALAPFVVRPREPAMRLQLACLVATYFFYFLVRFEQGHGWGYRYIHSAWGAIPVAAGVWFGREGAARTLGAVIVAAGLLATPAFLWETHGTIAEFLSHRIDPPPQGRWVVFVSMTRWKFAADLVQNLPGEDRVLRLISDGDAEDARLMAARFPQAVRVTDDVRGSAWRVPDDQPLPAVR